MKMKREVGAAKPIKQHPSETSSNIVLFLFQFISNDCEDKTWVISLKVKHHCSCESLIKQANSFTQIQLSLRFNQFNFNFNLRFHILLNHCDCDLELKTLLEILEGELTQLISWKKKQNSEQCCSFIKIIITNNKCFHCCYGNIFHCVVMIFSCYHVIIFD